MALAVTALLLMGIAPSSAEDEISTAENGPCAPATTNQGLTNMGFEDGLNGWTTGLEVEGTEVTAADGFTSPYEGSTMARLGQSQPSSGENQPEGANELCQDFKVTKGVETFVYNVFTYDYSGFDEFRPVHPGGLR